MKKIDHVQLIAILANIGVIAGIAFLAIELQQNNELLLAQARRDQLDARSAAGLVEVENPEISNITFKVANGDLLTPIERHRFFSWAMLLFGNWEWQFEEYEAGHLAEEDLPVVGWRGRARNLPLLEQLWNETKGNRSQAFIDYMEANVFTKSEPDK